MKPRLSGFMYAALLGAIVTVPTFAAAPYEETTVNGVTYTYTATEDGRYDAKAVIGGSIENVGSTYIAPSIHGDAYVDTTPIRNATIIMSGNYTISGILSGGAWQASPISGTVFMEVTDGSIDWICGGNRLDTDFTYGDAASIKGVTINVGGSAQIGAITGDSIVTFSNEYMSDGEQAAFLEKYTTTKGDIAINIAGNADVGNAYAAYYQFEKVEGSAAVTIDGGTVYYAFGNCASNVTQEASVTVNGGSVFMASAGYDGKTGGNANVTINGGITTYAYALASGTVDKDATLTIKKGNVDNAYGVTAGTVGGNVNITTSGGSAGYVYGLVSGRVNGDVNITTSGGNITSGLRGIYSGTVKGNVDVTTTGGNVKELYGAHYGTVEKDVCVTTTGGTVNRLCGNWDATVKGNLVVATRGGNVADLTGALGGKVSKDVIVTTSGGNVGGSCAVLGSYVEGDAYYNISGGNSGNIFGVVRGTVEGNATITMTGGTVNDIIGVSSDVYGKGTVRKDFSVHLLGGKVNGDVWGVHTDAEAASSTLYVGSQEKAYNGTVNDIKYFDKVVVAADSSIELKNGNVFSSNNMAITLSAMHLKQAVLKGTYAAIGAEGLTLNIVFDGPASSGKYIIAEADSFSKGHAVSTSDVPEGWDKVTVTGDVSMDDLTWEGTTLYLTYRALGIDAAVLSNWGVFKSSQAFVSTLWGARDNVVSLDGSPATDEKGNVLPAPAEAKNIAWGTVYGMSGRISDAGADYSLFGMAIGAERKFGKNSSVGLALGYDWGKVSPFTTTNVDQESVHLALYGRVGEWKAGKGVVAVDWSAAVGDTTSEHRDYRGDWSQTSWQLDARATYSRAINERTTASAFVGMQYYTHDSATADGVHVSGIENLRFQVGGGMSRKVSERASVYGEASMYFDAMRDNPYAAVNGAKFRASNPGRVGGKIGVGASYSINDKWSARGGYSFDVADDSTEHNVNVGATYKF